MVRKIIHIDEDKCNGCGLCAGACHEGAIEMVDGKAKLAREHFCDGLGDCLPACPTGAITFEEREAPAYDESAVIAAKEMNDIGAKETSNLAAKSGAHMAAKERAVSQLGQWPCQIKLVPAKAPFFSGASLLIAADCTAYAYASIHEGFMKGKATIVGCPKLDGVDYTEKLADIMRLNDIQDITVLRMEVPCCGGLQMAVQNALKASGKDIPLQVVTITIDGGIAAC